MTSPLTAALVDALPARARAATVRDATLPERLTAMLEACGAELDMNVPESFARFLGQRLVDDDDPLEQLLRLSLADLLLCHLALEGQGRAHVELDRRLAQSVPVAIARLRPTEVFAQEVTQLLRQKLLVPGSSGPAKLADYRGRGPLSTWLRVAALRVALNLGEAQRPKVPMNDDSDVFARVPAPGPDPELDLVRRRYAPEFKEAVERALQGLSPRERNLLRLYFVEGLTVEAIGRIENTHKSTVSRWLTKSRASLLNEVRAVLTQKLGLSADELNSLLGVLQSQLHVSLARVLR